MQLYNFLKYNIIYLMQFHQKKKSLGNFHKKFYTIQFKIEDKYPFNGIKPDSFEVTTSTKLQGPNSQNFSTNIEKLAQLSSNIFIQIIEIIQIHSTEVSYIIKYEYIPFPIVNSDQPTYYSQYQSEIDSICKQLAMHRIQVQPKIEDFGLTANKELRYFLRPNFKTIKLQTHQKQIRFMREMKQKFQEAFALSNLAMRGLTSSIEPRASDKGIEVIAQKIRKLRHNLFKVQMKNQEQKAVRKNQCRSEKNPSENSENNTPTIAKEELGFQQSRISSDKQHCFEDSYSWRDPKAKRKRTSSFQLNDKKPKSQNKNKKASWGQKCSVVQSDRATVLKKRVTDALMKTQNTLNKYEKIRTKSSRKYK